MGTTDLGLPYPAGTDLVMDGNDALQALAVAVNAKLIRHAAAGNRLDTASAAPSQPDNLRIFTGRLSASITSGLLNFTFSGTGFPNGVLGIWATTISGTPASPVINAGNVTKTGGQFFMSGSTLGTGVTGAVVVSYVAIGY